MENYPKTIAAIVVPVNDIKPHTEEDTTCECNPTVESHEGGLLVIHNSFDGREKQEQTD